MVSLLTHVAFVNVSHTSASLSSIESTVAARLMSAAGCDGSSQAAEQVDPRCSPASRIRRSRLGCSTRRDKGKLICTQACYSLVAGVSWLSGADGTSSGAGSVAAGFFTMMSSQVSTAVAGAFTSTT